MSKPDQDLVSVNALYDALKPFFTLCEFWGNTRGMRVEQ